MRAVILASLLVVAGCGQPAEPTSGPTGADAGVDLGAGLGLDLGADLAPGPLPDLATPRGLAWPAGQSFPSFAPPAALDVVDLTGAPADEVMLLVTLQGLINRTQPRIYLAADAREGKTFWLEKLSVPQSQVADPFSLITKYQGEIAGIVISDDAQPDTVNLATTIAGVEGGIVASPRLAAMLTAPPYGLPVLADLRQAQFPSKLAVYQAELDEWAARATPRLIVGISPTTTGARDLAVATGALVVWLDPTNADELALLEQVLTRLQPNSPYVGWWTDEPLGVAACSQYAVPVFAADLSANLTVLGGTPRGIAVTPPPPAPPLQNEIYVAIFMSDGDNVQEDQHLIPQKWADPNRGKVPIAWTVDPALVDLAPLILDYYWSTATPNDVLVSGPSGLGYTYPSAWPPSLFDEYTRRSNDYLDAAGLRVITVWNNGADLPASYATTFAQNLPRLLGSTIQASSSSFQLLGGSQPLLRLASPYASDEAGLESGIDSAASGWSGTSPLFIAVQGNMNQAAITPTTFYDVQQHYSSNAAYRFVRADHFFALLREANGLPVDPGRVARAPLGDFDGDRRADYAERDFTTGRFAVHSNAGSTFASATSAVGQSAAGPEWDTLVGDFDGDGRADYADHSRSDGHLIVHRNTGGGFDPASFEEGFTAYGPDVELLVADFDGDGKADYADHSLSDGHLSVHLNTGTGFSAGTFEEAFTAKGAGFELLVGDFDGDGKADYADHSLTDGHLWVHLNTGSGFSSSNFEEAFTQHGPGWELLVGDFDGDGKADYADHSWADGHLQVHRNNGSGFDAAVLEEAFTNHGPTIEMLGDSR